MNTRLLLLLAQVWFVCSMAFGQNPYFLSFSSDRIAAIAALDSLPGLETIVSTAEKIIVVDAHEAKIEYLFHQGKLSEITMVRRFRFEDAINQVSAIDAYFASRRFQTLMFHKSRTLYSKCYFYPGSSIVTSFELNRRGETADVVIQSRNTSHTPVYHWRPQDVSARVQAIPVGPMLRSHTHRVISSRDRPEGLYLYESAARLSNEMITRR